MYQAIYKTRKVLAILLYVLYRDAIANYGNHSVKKDHSFRFFSCNSKNKTKSQLPFFCGGTEFSSIQCTLLKYVLDLRDVNSELWEFFQFSIYISQLWSFYLVIFNFFQHYEGKKGRIMRKYDWIVREKSQLTVFFILWQEKKIIIIVRCKIWIV